MSRERWSGMRGTDPLERFMSKVDPQPNGCWGWLGAIGTTGYPTFSRGNQQKTYAHRWIVEHTFGPLELGTRITACSILRTCVNPDHLTTTTPAQRFWAQVAQVGDCWQWTGHKHKGNTSSEYGRFNGVLVHRWAYEFMVAPIPVGLTLDHLCRNPPCVNPAHLDPVPQSVNSRRANQGRCTNR